MGVVGGGPTMRQHAVCWNVPSPAQEPAKISPGCCRWDREQPQEGDRMSPQGLFPEIISLTDGELRRSPGSPLSTSARPFRGSTSRNFSTAAMSAKECLDPS